MKCSCSMKLHEDLSLAFFFPSHKTISMKLQRLSSIYYLLGKTNQTDLSSVGRAEDCSWQLPNRISLGRWFESGRSDIHFFFYFYFFLSNDFDPKSESKTPIFIFYTKKKK